MAFVTAAELATYLDKTFTAAQTTRAELLIELAQGVIEGEGGAGQALETAETTDTLDGTGTRKLILTRWPVTAVESVTETDVDGVAELLIEGADEDYTWSEYGILTRVGACWPAHDRSVAAVFTAGYAPAPSELRKICLRLAGDAFDSPNSFNRESLGDYSYGRLAEQVGMGLTKAEARTIGHYRART